MAFIEIGRIVRPQGLNGRLKVLSYLSSAKVLDTLAEVRIGREAAKALSYLLQGVQAGAGFLILKLAGIEDRDAAAQLVGSSLWMPRDMLEKLPEGEYYWQEILGLQVVTEAGEVLGRIESIFPTGSNDVYVCRAGSREILLPGISDVVRRIDPQSGVMVVRMLEGLTA
jgi:16S rRNA processing protein RimM